MTTLFGLLGLALSGIAGWFTHSAITRAWLRDALARLLVEARAVVEEVEQTYVDEILKGRLPDSPAGAELTKDEQLLAKAKAIAKLKENFGAKGLRRLARVLGLLDLDAYLGTHVESAVKKLSIAQVAAKSGSFQAVLVDPQATTRPLRHINEPF
jgi:hypothetical protein